MPGLVLMVLLGAFIYGRRDSGSGEAPARPGWSRDQVLPAAPRAGEPAGGRRVATEEEARVLLESGRVVGHIELMTEIWTDIEQSRVTRCSSPLVFVYQDGGWYMGTRGAYLRVEAGDLPEGWFEALERRRKRGFSTIRETDLYREEGTC